MTEKYHPLDIFHVDMVNAIVRAWERGFMEIDDVRMSIDKIYGGGWTIRRFQTVPFPMTPDVLCQPSELSKAMEWITVTYAELSRLAAEEGKKRRRLQYEALKAEFG